MGNDVNEAGEPVELFGTLELVLSEANSTNTRMSSSSRTGKKNLPGQDLAAGDEGPHQPGHVLQSA